MRAAVCCLDTLTTDETIAEARVRQDLRTRDLNTTNYTQSLSDLDMRRMGANGISDAVKHMAGVTLRDYGGAGGLKTAGIRGLGAQFTGVNYDGVAVSDIQTGQIDLQRYTLNGIRGVSLQVGDGSDIFVAARNASVPALLDIRTYNETTDNDLHLDAGLSLGSWGYTNPALRVGKTMGRLSLWAVADYVYAENDYPFTVYNVTERIHKHREHSLMNQGHVELNGAYRFGSRHTLRLKTYYYDNDRQLPGVVRYYTSESEQNLRERNAFVQAAYRGELGKGWSLKGAAKYNWACSDYKDYLYTDNIMDAKYWQRETYLTAATQWQATPTLAMSYASDYVYNSLSSRAQMTVNSRPTRQTLLNTMAVRWTPGPLTLSARMLYSVYLNDAHQGDAGDNYHRWTPSASMAVELAKGWRARLSYKRIFRMPSFSELYYYHLGTKQLQPEQTTQWNLGTTYARALSRRINVDATLDVYVNRVRDKIISIPVNLFIWQNVNAAKVRVRGLDLTTNVSYLLTRSHTLSLRAHYSLQKAVDRSSGSSTSSSTSYNRQIAYTPRHTFSIVLAWDNPWVNLAADLNGQSQRWATNQHTDGTDIPGYAELSLTASRAFIIARRHNINASFTLSNILDKQYEVIAHYPMPGRAWRLSLAYAF